MPEASNPLKERVRLLLWVLENLGEAPREKWAAYGKEMEAAPEVIRQAHANFPRAWVDLGHLEYVLSLGANTPGVANNADSH